MHARGGAGDSSAVNDRLASYFVIVASFAILFLLRRQVFWLIASVLGVFGFLDVLL